MNTFIPIMMFLLLRVLLRRTWAAVAIVTLLGLVLFYPGTGSVPVYAGFAVAVFSLLWLVLFRFGLLAAIAGLSMSEMLMQLPVTFDFSAGYASAGLIGLLLISGVTAWAFHTSVAGRPLFRDEILEAGGR